MGKFKALRNLTIGDGSQKDEKGKHIHRSVQKGEVFECDDSYAEEHLHPFDHVEETDEPVTAQVKAAAKKEARTTAKAGKAKPEPKEDDKGKKGK
jgi:hypothetical protein